MLIVTERIQDRHEDETEARVPSTGFRRCGNRIYHTGNQHRFELAYDQTRFMVGVIRSGLSYRPVPGRVTNIGYRYTRDLLHQVDAAS